MISQGSFELKINNVGENHIPNFILDRFTMTLSYKLAVAAFMNTGNEVANIQAVENFGAVYNEGNIISDFGVQPPSISKIMKSKTIHHKTGYSIETPDIVASFWHNLMSSLSDILKFVHRILF